MKLEKIAVARLVLAKQQEDDAMYNEALYALLHDDGGNQTTTEQLVERLARVIQIMANDLAVATFALAGGDRAGAVQITQKRLAALMGEEGGREG